MKAVYMCVSVQADMFGVFNGAPREVQEGF